MHFNSLNQYLHASESYGGLGLDVYMLGIDLWLQGWGMTLQCVEVEKREHVAFGFTSWRTAFT